MIGMPECGCKKNGESTPLPLRSFGGYRGGGIHNRRYVMGFALSDLQLSSPAFASGRPIPARHTGEGADTSPILEWRNLPEGTRGLAVFCHDPDAPLIQPGSYGFVHWVLYNLPPDL